MSNLLEQYGKTLSQYWEFSNEMEKVLQDMGQVRLPIDINSVAKKLGFHISFYDEISNDQYGFVRKKEIEVSSNLFYKERRWAIAKAIALHHLGKGFASIQKPFLVNDDIDTFEADPFSILILLPIFLFKKDLSEYLSEYQAKIGDFCGEKYLEHLCNCSQIPMFHLVTGYQLINQMLCYQRQKAFIDCGYDITKCKEDEYENIYL